MGPEEEVTRTLDSVISMGDKLGLATSTLSEGRLVELSPYPAGSELPPGG